MNEPTAKALNSSTVALVNNGGLYIMESQQEFEGESGMVTPAKSIWLNRHYAKILRDFLNEQYPVD